MDRKRPHWSFRVLQLGIVIVFVFGISSFLASKREPLQIEDDLDLPLLNESQMKTPNLFAQPNKQVPLSNTNKLPTIATVAPPNELQDALVACFEPCSEPIDKTQRDQIYGRQASNMFKTSPFHVKHTNQFSLGLIMDDRLKEYRKHAVISPAHANTDEADFVYVDVEATQDLRRCFRCAEKRQKQNLTMPKDPEELQKRFNTWFLGTLADLRKRRDYPSTFMVLPRINKVFTSNILSEEAQRYLDDVSVFGIEGSFYLPSLHLPNFVNLPYPSRFHLAMSSSTAARSNEGGELSDLGKWQQTALKKRYLYVLPSLDQKNRRARLQYAVGRLKVQSGRGTRLRTALANDLAMYQEDPKIWTSTSLDSMATAYRAMGAATFCLEPIGDSPTRRGFTDAILLGCIPVIFESDAYGNFTDIDLNSLAHIIPFQTYMKGERSIVDWLSDIPEAEIQEKRDLIASVAHRFQYAFPDSDQPGMHLGQPGDDAFGQIIRHLQDQRREKIEWQLRR